MITKSLSFLQEPYLFLEDSWYNMRQPQTFVESVNNLIRIEPKWTHLNLAVDKYIKVFSSQQSQKPSPTLTQPQLTEL